MVHATYARPDGRVVERSRRFVPPRAWCDGEPQRTDRYVLVPDGLILAFAHDPLAVGVYTAIARLVMAAKDAVPLAARDLAAWMGSDREADRAAIMRRIAKLEARGWLMITRTRASKHHLLPTWGAIEWALYRRGVWINPIAAAPRMCADDGCRSVCSTHMLAVWIHSLAKVMRS